MRRLVHKPVALALAPAPELCPSGAPAAATLHEAQEVSKLQVRCSFAPRTRFETLNR
jgi:hypothetical protein